MATVMHNHLTRDIRPKGDCPKCDEHWSRVASADRNSPRTPCDYPACDCEVPCRAAIDAERHKVELIEAGGEVV